MTGAGGITGRDRVSLQSIPSVRWPTVAQGADGSAQAVAVAELAWLAPGTRWKERQDRCYPEALGLMPDFAAYSQRRNQAPSFCDRAGGLRDPASDLPFAIPDPWKVSPSQ